MSGTIVRRQFDIRCDVISDPTFRYRSSTEFFQLRLPDPDDVIRGICQMALLGDELFASESSYSGASDNVIHVWSMADHSAAGNASVVSYADRTTDKCMLPRYGDRRCRLDRRN